MKIILIFGITYLDILGIEFHIIRKKGTIGDIALFLQQFITIDTLHYSIMVLKRMLKITTKKLLLPMKFIFLRIKGSVLRFNEI